MLIGGKEVTTACTTTQPVVVQEVLFHMELKELYKMYNLLPSPTSDLSHGSHFDMSQRYKLC